MLSLNLPAKILVISFSIIWTIQLLIPMTSPAAIKITKLKANTSSTVSSGQVHKLNGTTEISRQSEPTVIAKTRHVTSLRRLGKRKIMERYERSKLAKNSTTNTGSSKESSIKRAEEECIGFHNIVEDLGVLTYLNDVVISNLGFLLLPPALIAQIYGYISSYLISFPSIMFYLLDIPRFHDIEVFLDLIGISDTMFDILANLPFNDVVNLLGGVVETVSAINLLAETFGSFPGFFELVMNEIFGVDAYEYFEGYACGDVDEV